MTRSLECFMCLAMAACAALPAAAAAQPAFERVAAFVEFAGGYSMRVESHEERDDRSEDLTYRYHRLPAPAGVRVEMLEGRGAETALTTVGADRVLVSGRGGLHVVLSTGDPRIVSLRETAIARAGLEPFVACVRAHRAALSQTDGPEIDRVATIALVFRRRHVGPCPGDSKLDAAITTDILYVARLGCVPILRKRYVGREVVERLRIRDFTVGTPSEI